MVEEVAWLVIMLCASASPLFAATQFARAWVSGNKGNERTIHWARCSGLSTCAHATTAQSTFFSRVNTRSAQDSARCKICSYTIRSGLRSVQDPLRTPLSARFNAEDLLATANEYAPGFVAADGMISRCLVSREVQATAQGHVHIANRQYASMHSFGLGLIAFLSPIGILPNKRFFVANFPTSDCLL